MQPHYSPSSHENVTPSSGTSPLAYYYVRNKVFTPYHMWCDLIDHPPTSQTFFFDKYVVLDRPQTSIVLSTESCKNDYIFWVYVQ